MLLIISTFITNLKMKTEMKNKRLRIDKKTWMIDNKFQRDFAKEKGKLAKGKCLIGGLGLGIMHEEFLKNKNVTELITIEINKEVIRLMNEQKPEIMNHPKHTIILGDFNKYILDCEYFDVIYPSIYLAHNRDDKINYFNNFIPIGKNKLNLNGILIPAVPNFGEYYK